MPTVQEELQRFVEEIQRAGFALGYREAVSTRPASSSAASSDLPPVPPLSSADALAHALAEGEQRDRADSARGRGDVRGAENVLRIGRTGAPADPAAGEEDVNRAGQAAIDLVNQFAGTITDTEKRIESLLARALERFRTLEERLTTLEQLNRNLERRAAQSEARAREAEKWVQRLHVEIEEKLASLRNARLRAPGNTAAA
jgi:hypothetical protein